MKAFVLINHPLLPEQEAELRESFGVGAVYFLPEDLRERWAACSPEADINSSVAEPFLSWIWTQAEGGDIVIVQGEPGLVFFVANACLDRGLVPVHAATKREVLSEKAEDGSVRKLSKFRHIRFRKYKRPYN